MFPYKADCISLAQDFQSYMTLKMSCKQIRSHHKKKVRGLDRQSVFFICRPLRATKGASLLAIESAFSQFVTIWTQLTQKLYVYNYMFEIINSNLKL